MGCGALGEDRVSGAAALTRLAGIGVDRAVAALRDLVGIPVAFVPSMPEVVRRSEISAALGLVGATATVGVRQEFEGAFPGRALLIFPDTASLVLVRLALGGAPALEDVAELECEAMAEIGNIVLNALVGTIANRIGLSLPMSLPEIVGGASRDILTEVPERDGDHLIVAGIDCRIDGETSRVLLILDVGRFNALAAAAEETSP